MSTLRHSYGDSVILASLKTSVPERKSPSFDGHLYIKKFIYFWSSRVKTQGNICATSPFCFSAGCTAVYGWRQRVTIPVSHALIPDLGPSFQTMATPTGKLDVSQADVSPKKIQKKPHRYLTMAGRIGVTIEILCDTATPHQSNNFPKEQDIVRSWHWTLCPWLPCQVPSVKKSSDRTHARLHNPNCSLRACPKKQQ